jgi:hypothetical protein
MRALLQRLAALLLAGLIYAAPAAAEVIDAITLEPRDGSIRIGLHLTGPVRYLRHAPIERGEMVVVLLEALQPEAFDPRPQVEEVKRGPPSKLVPRFTARVSFDPACSPSARPLCITLRFEQPVRYRVRLGPDRRSVLVELLPEERAP